MKIIQKHISARIEQNKKTNIQQIDKTSHIDIVLKNQIKNITNIGDELIQITQILCKIFTM